MTTCRNKKYNWSNKSIAKSPFRTLKNAKQAEKALKKGKSIGFTRKSSLKSMGRIPRASGCYELGNKYK